MLENVERQDGANSCQSFQIEIVEEERKSDVEMVCSGELQISQTYNKKRKFRFNASQMGCPYDSFESLKFLKQLRELSVFEHSQYGRIIAAAFDTVLIIVITK